MSTDVTRFSLITSSSEIAINDSASATEISDEDKEDKDVEMDIYDKELVGEQ